MKSAFDFRQHDATILHLVIESSLNFLTARYNDISLPLRGISVNSLLVFARDVVIHSWTIFYGHNFEEEPIWL